MLNSDEDPLGIDDKVYVNRGYEPSAPGYGYGYREVSDLSGLPRRLA
jgi:hypothetical protein